MLQPRLLFILPILLFGIKVYSQTDTTYIGSFNQDFSARSYITTKISGLDKMTRQEYSGFIYRINAPVGIGVGASWKNYAFAFSRRIDFLRDPKKGKTNSLEFQYYGYRRKFAYSLSLQQHDGFYNTLINSNGSYTTYPKMKLHMYGGTFQWVFNNKKFSYKAAFNQNERQLKSSGSFLLGVAAYYTKLNTDTLKLLSNIGNMHENIQFGITGGYAYSWVFSRPWFVTGSLDLGINFGHNNPKQIFNHKMDIYPTLNSRIAVGYNLDSWSFGLSSYFNRVYLFIDGKDNLSVNEFNIQLTFIKRFNWGNKFVNKTLNDTKRKLDRFGF
ncbi:MAG: DUF4421 family protein [Dysgonomonas sp.]